MPTFEIKKSFTFEAGHALLHHDGKCRHPHGHSYQLTLFLRSDNLNLTGPKKNMLMDFYDISKIVKPMIEKYLDHHWINDTLDCDSPTSEFIAKWIFDHLKPQLPMLYSVAIAENNSSSATYHM